MSDDWLWQPHWINSVCLLFGSASIPPSLCTMFWNRIWHLRFDGTSWENKDMEVLECVSPVVHPFPSGTGMWMNLPVAARSAWSCTISHRHQRASGAHTCSSGMMTGATWRTISFANTLTVTKLSPSYMATFPTSFPLSKTAAGTKNLFCAHWESLLQMPATLNFELLVDGNVMTLRHWELVLAKERLSDAKEEMRKERI